LHRKRYPMYNAPVLKKGIEILRLVTHAGEPLGVSEIARKLSIVKSTALGILKALEGEGLVAQDPVTVKLVDETVILAATDEDDTVRVLEVREPKKELKITVPVGTHFPLYTGALMKVFLSRMKNEDILRYVKEHPLPAYTDRSVTRVEDLMEQVERVRQLGYATDLEEYRRGVRGAAVLVYRGPSATAAISVFGLASSMDDGQLDRIVLHLKNTAQLISTRLTLMARHGEGQQGPSSDDGSAGLNEYSSGRGI